MNTVGHESPIRWFERFLNEFLSVEYIVSVADAVRATAKPGEQSAFYREITDNYRWL